MAVTRVKLVSSPSGRNWSVCVADRRTRALALSGSFFSAGHSVQDWDLGAAPRPFRETVALAAE